MQAGIDLFHLQRAFVSTIRKVDGDMSECEEVSWFNALAVVQIIILFVVYVIKCMFCLSW